MRWISRGVRLNYEEFTKKNMHASDRLGTPKIGKLSRILVEAEYNACLHVTNIGSLSNFQKF